jgi:glycerol-1-phosphate dehydrogenase [NAD(P)+]
MALAGSSAPASGGEHLISHYWDMTAHDAGRTPALHGAQVGVATLLTAALYERVRLLDPEQLNVEHLLSIYLSEEELLEELKSRHGEELAAIIKAEALAKHMPKEQKRRQLNKIVGGWEAMWNAVGAGHASLADILATLQKAQAPVSADALGIGRTEIYSALTRAKDIRNRYTILDLASDLGILEEIAEEVIEESGVGF